MLTNVKRPPILALVYVEHLQFSPHPLLFLHFSPNPLPPVKQTPLGRSLLATTRCQNNRSHPKVRRADKTGFSMF